MIAKLPEETLLQSGTIVVMMSIGSASTTSFDFLCRWRESSHGNASWNFKVALVNPNETLRSLLVRHQAILNFGHPAASNLRTVNLRDETVVVFSVDPSKLVGSMITVTKSLHLEASEATLRWVARQSTCPLINCVLLSSIQKRRQCYMIRVELCKTKQKKTDLRSEATLFRGTYLDD